MSTASIRISCIGFLAMVAWVLAGCSSERFASRSVSPPEPLAEKRAVDFLSREVPLWFKKNKCFSCHNNGDAARALFTASALGHRIPKESLADTIAWLRRPEQWDHNKGDPAFSDKRLARVQFTGALAGAVDTRWLTDTNALFSAARKLVEEQNPDGSWHIEPVSALGSPATYGTSLATAMAVKSLANVRDDRVVVARQKAERWLRQSRPNNVLDAAAVLMGLAGDADPPARVKRRECFDLIRRAQARDGGWGPYGDSPPEPFDTAVVLLALTGVFGEDGVGALLDRGRSYLRQTQLEDGSWPETTRPPRGESYAQRISTTGWATLALLRTRAAKD